MGILRHTRGWKRLSRTTRVLRAAVKEHIKKSVRELDLTDGFADSPM